MPKVSIKGRLEKDINVYKHIDGDMKNLHKLPRYVGGNIDLMIDIKYLKYYPENIFQLLPGISVYKLWLKNSDSSRGVIGGPYKVFTRTESTYQAQTTTVKINITCINVSI